MTVPTPPIPPPQSAGSHRQQFDRDLVQIRRRIVHEATVAVDMLEASFRALTAQDTETARDVRRGEDSVDVEEVAIESECLRLMTLQQPVGADFRLLTFCLKVNSDIERVADHASSIAKITLRLSELGPGPPLPTALAELGQRVPLACHRLLRAVLDQDEAEARSIVTTDKVIDDLDKRLFKEILQMLARHPDQAERGLLLYRVGRDLERVGDLMGNIAEDLVYLITGQIIRHTKPKPAAP